MSEVKFGIRLPVSGPLAGPDAIATAATEAERLGFDSIWVHDFIAWNKILDSKHVSSGAAELVKEDTVPVMLESLISLTYAAAVTKSIKVGTSILCLPYREPIVTAKQVATLDRLSNGRLILGVGVGGTRKTNNRDFELLGIPRTEKYERTGEYLQAMRTIWENDEASFEGKFVSFPPTEIGPRPVQKPIPLWLGGKGEKSLDLITSYGHGWLPTWLAADQYENYLPRIRELLVQKGRSPDALTIAKECAACIAETSEEAERISHATVETFSHGFTVGTYEAAKASALIGSPAEIRKQVQEFVDVGVTYFEMKFIYHSVEQLVEELSLFSSEVISHFSKTPAATAA